MTRPPHLGGADGGVGTSGRPAHHGEPLDAERRGELLDVSRPVDQAASRLVGREPHAGSVGGDQAHPGGHGGLVCGRGVEAGAHPAVEAEDREAGGIPVLLVGQHPPVGQRHRSGHARAAPSLPDMAATPGP